MSGSNVLVTGGTRGIGKGIVLELASRGFHVGFCGRGDAGEMRKFADEVSGRFHVPAKGFHCDVSDAAEREALIRDFVAEFGTLDVLVNNAGVAPDVRADLLEMSEASFDRVMGINLRGPFFLTQLAAKAMCKFRGDGVFRAIINTGSVSAVYASVNRGEYCLSKAAVAMATKLYAARLAEEGIAVYELRPGIVKSDMTEVVTAKYDKLIADGLTLQKRWGMPEDIGKAVAVLASGMLGYSTGQVINIDGGLTVERF
ncbi:MAG: 3-ketoacyl-ACP reductase [Victivallaceae bacterium]|nr:3-ketoacyl-ACP reductase [Victivallaceae bacterium]